MILIVGIDVGITSSIAILDKSGKLIFIKSKKDYKKEEIISDIINFGTPIAICYDKPKIPKKIKKIASAFRVRIVTPNKEVKNVLKFQIVKKYFGKVSNSHERDALFAALIGYKKLRRKIEKYEKRYKTEEIVNFFKY